MTKLSDFYFDLILPPKILLVFAESIGNYVHARNTCEQNQYSVFSQYNIWFAIDTFTMETNESRNDEENHES
ncbi:hypothetical protein MASR2M78_28750 [Treponema sp.]